MGYTNAPDTLLMTPVYDAAREYKTAREGTRNNTFLRRGGA